ncbi:MAG: peptidoglycan-binding protein LysM [Pseudomonadota bacterium]
MGFWSFLTGSGKDVGVEADKAEESAEKIKAEIAGLGLEAGGVEIAVEGDTVKLSGAAVSQEVKEKIILAAGNIEGIAGVEESVAAPDEKEPVFHTVEKGDTLWAISSKHLGNGAHYEKIFEANKPMLSHPDKIYPGQVLRIPV